MKTSVTLPAFLRSQKTIFGAQIVVGAIVIVVVFWLLQFSTQAICCGDFDGYYHIKWSRMLWESLRSRSFPPLFTSLPLTTLNPESYVDHHLLFHIFQIPFTFGDLRDGAKLASLIFASIAVFSCFWLLLHFRVRYGLIWLLALLGCSAPFLYRLNMAKAPPFAIIFLVLGIFLLFKKRYWPLGPLAFVFGLTYDMVVLLILAACIWVVVIAWTEHRFEWRPLAWVMIGTAAGFVINPYFPQNLQLFYEHLRIKVTPGDFSTQVGNEWYPYNTWEFLGNSIVACVAMVVGYTAFDAGDRHRAHHPLFFLLFSTVLMIMTARWKRIAEYWPPFAVMFSAFALQPWLSGARTAFSKLPTDVMDELQPFLDRDGATAAAKEAENRALRRTVVGAVVAIALAVAAVLNIRATMVDIGKSERHEYYRAGAEWMRANVPPGEIVFNTDWDDFPRLFYFDPTHRYISGLDPTYLYDKDLALAELYDRINLGKEDNPGPLIRDRFGSRYVFTDNRHGDFYDKASESGWFEIVYEDTQCMILRIRDKKLEPEPEPEEPLIEGQTGATPPSPVP
ncbi:MAG TPA: hypothetical protein VJ864_16595 [Candidatus Binatia bacterium]|nr:hypothetical protein [Candidatus Binatia bacterium]